MALTWFHPKRKPGLTRVIFAAQTKPEASLSIEVTRVIIPPPIDVTPPPTPSFVTATPLFYDGPGGITGKGDDTHTDYSPGGFANVGYHIPWTNVGGDWLDAAGTPQGSSAYGQAGVSGSTIQVDITALVQKWYRSGNTGCLIKQTASGDCNLFTRKYGDSSKWPTLTINGSVVAQCSCFGYLDLSTTAASTAGAVSIDWSYHAVIQFTLPQVDIISSAVMTLQVYTSSGGYQLGVFEARHPPIFGGGVAQMGIAAAYPRDAGLSGHAAIIHWTDFTPGSFESYYMNTPGSQMAGADQLGVFFSDLGAKGMTAHYNANALQPIDGEHQSSYQNINATARDELYYRYYFWIDPNYPSDIDGMKLPGQSGRYGNWNTTQANRYDAQLGGNGGNPVTGLGYDSLRPSQSISGFSLRTHVLPIYWDYASNPIPLNAPLDTYAYYSQMVPYWGNIWQWGDDQIGYVLLWPNTWYCLETRVKMNDLTGTPDASNNYTPVANGIFEGWVDGVKVISRTNIIYRYHPDIHIDETWFTHQHGGSAPAGQRRDFKHGPMAVATQYIGPMGGLAPMTAVQNVQLRDANPCQAENSGNMDSCVWSGSNHVNAANGGFTLPSGVNAVGLIGAHQGGSQFSGAIYCEEIDATIYPAGGEPCFPPAMAFDFAGSLPKATGPLQWVQASQVPRDIQGYDYVHCNNWDGYHLWFNSTNPANDQVCPMGHTYQAQCYLPSWMGGGPLGSLVLPTREVTFGIARNNLAMKFDLSKPDGPHGWSEASNGECVTMDKQNTGHSFIADYKNRRFLGLRPAPLSNEPCNLISYLQFSDNSGVGQWGASSTFSQVNLPSQCVQIVGHARTCVIAGGDGTSPNQLMLMAYDLDNLNAGIHQLTLTNVSGDHVYGPACGFAYASDTGEYWVLPCTTWTYVDAYTVIDAFYRIVPPADPAQRFTGTWTMYRVDVSADGMTGYMPDGLYGRFFYRKRNKSLCLSGGYWNSHIQMKRVL
jgi:hypothetical protein